jgi:hypothetical protein
VKLITVSGSHLEWEHALKGLLVVKPHGWMLNDYVVAAKRTDPRAYVLALWYRGLRKPVFRSAYGVMHFLLRCGLAYWPEGECVSLRRHIFRYPKTLEEYILWRQRGFLYGNKWRQWGSKGYLRNVSTDYSSEYVRVLSDTTPQVKPPSE